MKSKKRKVVTFIPKLSRDVNENIEMFEEQATMVSNKAGNKLEDIEKLIVKFRESITDKATVNYVFWKVVKIYLDYNYTRKSILERILFRFTPYYFYVYQLVRDGEIVYVGKSERLESRIQQHISSGKIFDSVRVYLCTSEEEQNTLENTCILKIWPEYNKSVNMGSASRNLEIPEFVDMREFKPDFMPPNPCKYKFNNDDKYYYVQCCGFVKKDCVPLPRWFRTK